MFFCQVSNTRKEKLVFTINKMINVDTPQPASVSIYEYYSTGEKRHNPSLSLLHKLVQKHLVWRLLLCIFFCLEKPCVEFYDTQREKGLLDTLCHSEVCLCAEGELCIILSWSYAEMYKIQKFWYSFKLNHTCVMHKRLKAHAAIQ